jgi:hypothetical protein
MLEAQGPLGEAVRSGEPLTAVEARAVDRDVQPGGDARSAGRSTIITTNLDYDQWYAFLGSKPMVAALLDRLRHHCHTIRIDGPSLREPVSTV